MDHERRKWGIGLAIYRPWRLAKNPRKRSTIRIGNADCPIIVFLVLWSRSRLEGAVTKTGPGDQRGLFFEPRTSSAGASLARLKIAERTRLARRLDHG